MTRTNTERKDFLKIMKRIFLLLTLMTAALGAAEAKNDRWVPVTMGPANSLVSVDSETVRYSRDAGGALHVIAWAKYMEASGGYRLYRLEMRDSDQKYRFLASHVYGADGATISSNETPGAWTENPPESIGEDLYTFLMVTVPNYRAAGRAAEGRAQQAHTTQF